MTKKILIIDDDDSFRLAMVMTLRKQGYNLLDAAAGRTGLELARTHSPDLVLCDVNMAPMDGFGVLEALRSQPLTSVIPVVLMTGGARDLDVRYGMEQGADDYLPKPFSMAAMLATVRARLERQQSIAQRAKENEARLLEVLSATHDLVAIADATTERLLYLNRAGRTMLAIDPEADISTLRLADFQAEAQTAASQKEKVAQAKCDYIWVGESAFVSRTGRHVPVSKQILAHRETTGEITFLSIVARDITERLAAEQTLRDSENLYRNLIQSQGEGFVMVEPNLRFTFANPAAETIFAVPAGQLVGRNVHDFLDAQGKLTTAAQLKLRQAGKRSSFELELHLASGERRQTLVTGTPKFDGDGQFCGTYAVFRDITERKRAEEKLHLLTSALEAAANGVVISDRNGHILWVNPAFTCLTGYSAAEAIGNTPAVLKSGVQGKEFYSNLWQTVLSGRVWQGELVNRRKDGSHYCEEMTITPVPGSDGQIQNFVAIKQDITQRKEFERTLEHERDLLQSLMDNLPDHIYFKDLESRFTRINQAHARSLGLSSPQEAVGKSDADFFPVRFWRQTLVDEGRILATGEPILGALEEAQTSAGKNRWLSATKVAIRDRAGNITGLVGVSRDMTEHKRSEQERQLMELQLRQAQKLEAIGQLAAGIAHEINTPTQYVGDNTRFLKDSFSSIATVLISYGELLTAVKTNAVLPGLVAKIDEVIAASDLSYLFEQIPAAITETLEGVERVTKIVRAMKEFSHPGGKEKIAADLNKAIETTVTVARNEWKYVADLELDLDPALPPVPCFLGEFNQCILNLIVNAAHAISDVIRQHPGTKGRITIRTRGEGDHVEVRVSDTGTGIPETSRSRIFEPFFTTKDVGKGTGQGLSIVYGSIVKKHGGSVTFETETGQGTTFILRLPVVARMATTEPGNLQKAPLPESAKLPAM